MATNYSAQNKFNTSNSDDLIFGKAFENNLIDGLDGNDKIIGGVKNDTLVGGKGDDRIIASFGDDIIIGGQGSDTLSAGPGADVFAYAGDPFEGQDISAPDRQIIGDEDFVEDFDFAEDTYQFNATDFDITGDVKFTALDANAEDASIEPGTNVVTLLNSDNDGDPNTPFLAGTAANQIAELTSEDGAGLFVYFNSDLQLNRLAYSTNLNDASADLKIVSRQTDLTGQGAIDALNNFSADNFQFEAIQQQAGDDGADNAILGDANNNELIGTAGNDVINGLEGNDTLFGDVGSDTLSGGVGADVFAYAGDPFDGQDVSAPDRQIIGDEDFVGDFDFAEDTYQFNATDFDITGDVKFTALDANAQDAAIEPGTNVVTLLNSDNDGDPNTPFLAGTAANQIAELTSEDGAGLFVYFNSDLQLNRLAYSTNLNDASADLKIVSRQTDLTGQGAIDALNNFSADNFQFEAIQQQAGDDGADNAILGDANNNELIGTAGNDVINGLEGNDTLFGDVGSDTFVFSDNYLSGATSDPDDIKVVDSNADNITDFSLDDDRLLLDRPTFDGDEVKFANLAAGDSISGANVIVLDEPVSSPLDAVNDIFGSEAQLDSGVVISFDNSEENKASVVQYSGLDDLFSARGGVVTTLDDLSFEDLADFSADNFTFGDSSEAALM